MTFDFTVQSMDDLLSKFRDKVNQVRNTPSDIDHAFKILLFSTYTHEFGSEDGLIHSLIQGFMTGGTDDVAYVQNQEQEIKKEIQNLLDKLADAIEAVRAPIAFLKTGEAWLTLQSTIRNARNLEENQATVSDWSGTAADKYSQTARPHQTTALKTMESLCGTLHDSMYAIAQAAWDFYTDVVDKLVTFLTSMGSAVTKIETVFMAPQGISDALNASKQAASDVFSLGQKLGKVLFQQDNQNGVILAAISFPEGFVDNKWPQPGDDGAIDIDSPSGQWQPK